MTALTPALAALLDRAGCPPPVDLVRRAQDLLSTLVTDDDKAQNVIDDLGDVLDELQDALDERSRGRC